MLNVVRISFFMVLVHLNRNTPVSKHKRGTNAPCTEIVHSIAFQTENLKTVEVKDDIPGR